MKKKNLGFTLAEVLIVIGIIGVVAALTLPNLNHATGDKEKVTKVKKIYSNLTEAVDRAQAIYGNADTWFKDLGDEDVLEKSERAAKRITEFLKVSKDCGNNSGCFSQAPLLTSGGEEWKENLLNDWLANDYMVILTDGTALAFYYGNFGGRLEVTVDIDGPNKGKNQYGSDIFAFKLGLLNGSEESLYLQLIPDTPIRYNDAASLSGNATAWVIENGNLDYLKCPEELNWETKTSCE